MELVQQVKDLPVEILVCLDDGKRTSGDKRNELMRRTTGEYVCFVDDDDWVSPNYVSSLASGCKSGADVVSFSLKFTNPGRKDEYWRFGLHENYRDLGLMCVNHLCAWKRSLAEKVAWSPDLGYRDDHLWFQPLFASGLVRTCYQIDDVLYHYQYDSNVSVNQKNDLIVFSQRHFGSGVSCFMDGEGRIFVQVPRSSILYPKKVVPSDLIVVRDQNLEVSVRNKRSLRFYHKVHPSRGGMIRRKRNA